MRVLMLLCFVACIGSSDEAKPVPRKQPAPLKPTHVAPLQPDCDRMHRLEGEVSSAYVAKDHVNNYRRAIEMAPAVPQVCRAGWWYLAVARLLDLGVDREIAGFKTPEAALEAGLQQPDDVRVLVRVAQVAALGRKPALPADACERARMVTSRTARTDEESGARYVCGRAAIASGDGARAIVELDAYLDTSATWDVELARAQAAKLVKDRASTIRHARLAIAAANKLGMRTTELDRDVMLRLAEALAR